LQSISVRVAFICIILFLVPAASGDTISEILEKKYLDFAHGLDYSGVYAPDKLQQNYEHIHAWIDIVGYNDMICIDGEYYIPDDPLDYVIVQSDKWESADGWNTGVKEFTDEITVTSDGNTITASMDIYLKWYKVTLKLYPFKHLKKTYYTEEAIFYDTDIVPQTLQSLDNTNVSIEVVIYNNSISPKTSILIENVPLDAISINYTYNNESIIHHRSTATQEYTDKNCPYMLINSSNIWEMDGNLSRFGEFVIIPTMNFSSSNLTVTLNSPYESYAVDNITVYELECNDPGDVFSSLFWPFISLVGLFVFASIVQIRRF